MIDIFGFGREGERGKGGIDVIGRIRGVFFDWSTWICMQLTVMIASLRSSDMRISFNKLSFLAHIIV